MSTQADGTLVTGTFAELFAETDAERVYLLDPPEVLLRPLVESLAAFDGVSPTVRVLTDGTTLRRFRRDFEAAATAAGLVADGSLAVRAWADGGAVTPLLAGPDRVYVPVLLGGVDTVVAAAPADCAPSVFQFCVEAWGDTDHFPLRTPPLAAVRESLASEFGPEFRADFDAVRSTTERGHDPREFDPALVALCLGAHYERLHYDVSGWGAEIGLASKATFSRKKGHLEDLGVLTTEQVSTRTGRPRQRLLLTDEYRERVADEGIVAVIRSLLY